MPEQGTADVEVASRQHRRRLLGHLCYIAGWVLIARYFGRLWVWSIPLALGLLTLAKLALTLAPALGWTDIEHLIHNPTYRTFTFVVHAAYALAVLALGLSLLGQRAGSSLSWCLRNAQVS